jgi:hypothetical protein
LKDRKEGRRKQLMAEEKTTTDQQQPQTPLAKSVDEKAARKSSMQDDPTIQMERIGHPAAPEVIENPPAAPVAAGSQEEAAQAAIEIPPDTTAIAPQSAVVVPDPNVLGLTTVSPGSVPTSAATPVLIGATVKTEQQSETISATGGKEFPLEHKPTRIDSVTVNGQTFSVTPVANVEQDVVQAANQVLYDVEKGALVFANDVQGLIQVAYSFVPAQSDQGTIHEMLAWFHERLTALESAFGKLRGANLV